MEIPAPMLAAPVEDWALRPGIVAEPKWDGFRAILARMEDGRPLIRSRQGTDMTRAFPEIAGPLAALPVPAVLDGEIVAWEGGRLRFDRLLPRLGRTAASAARYAREAPASVVVFDVLHWDGVEYRGRSYARRRVELEGLFSRRLLVPPYNLCPATGDPAVAQVWLDDWGPRGVEGLVLKRTAGTYRPGTRGWAKWRIRRTEEGIVGAVTGSSARPRLLLLGRYDDEGRLRYMGRSVPVSADLSRLLGGLLEPAVGAHPWRGRTFSAAWGVREVLDVDLVEPRIVVEVSADTSRDSSGRWRHAVRVVRHRPDLTPQDVARFDA